MFGHKTQKFCQLTVIRLSKKFCPAKIGHRVHKSLKINVSLSRNLKNSVRCSMLKRGPCHTARLVLCMQINSSLPSHLTGQFSCQSACISFQDVSILSVRKNVPIMAFNRKISGTTIRAGFQCTILALTLTPCEYAQFQVN